MLTLNKKYFLVALILFLIEVYIAIYIKDKIIRPYIGDYLVVILIYCSVKAIVNSAPFKTAIAVLIFAYLVEFLQYLKILKLLGLHHNRLANIIVGNGFEWMDMLMYSLGIATVLLLERLAENR